MRLTVHNNFKRWIRQKDSECSISSRWYGIDIAVRPAVSWRVAIRHLPLFNSRYVIKLHCHYVRLYWSGHGYLTRAKIRLERGYRFVYRSPLSNGPSEISEVSNTTGAKIMKRTRQVRILVITYQLLIFIHFRTFSETSKGVPCDVIPEADRLRRSTETQDPEASGSPPGIYMPHVLQRVKIPSAEDLALNYITRISL